MSEHDKQQLRMECLQMALQSSSVCEAIDYARQFYDYIIGANDAEVLRAARDLAEKVRSGA